MGEHKVDMYEDVIRAILLGVLQKRNVDALLAQIHDMVQNTKKGLVYLDIGGTDEITGEARRALAEYISMQPHFFDKLAICGVKAKNRVMANFIIAASGEGNSVRYFESKEEAIKWLKE